MHYGNSDAILRQITPGVLLSRSRSRRVTLPESLPASYSPGVTPGAILSRSHSRCLTLPECILHPSFFDPDERFLHLAELLLHLLDVCGLLGFFFAHGLQLGEDGAHKEVQDGETGYEDKGQEEER